MLEPVAASALATAEGRCVGLTLRPREGGPFALSARAVILATGGMAALWQRTTNPRGAIGAGLSLASEAGALLADLEFMQFHPTALRLEGPRDGFLVTEAVRGEGARLYDSQGERFVDELAPRDEVALAIQTELERTGEPAVWLDMRHVEVERFPNIAAALADVGLNPARDLLPVAPAAHYTMGGVATDLDGRSTLPGPVRGRRGGVHGPPRREPAGLELAGRVHRVRRAGRRWPRAGEPERPRRRRASRTRPSSAPPIRRRGDPRGAVALRRAAARRRRAGPAARTTLIRSRA